MKIGYLRVSTEDQRTDRQIDGLTPLCDHLYVEKLSAVAKRRPVFERVLASLSKGDTLVVWALDRAFRSTIDAITIADELKTRGVEFQIVNLGVDTSTADGKLIFTVIAAMAEHERNRLSERTKQGLEAARRRGAQIGRPYALSKQQRQLVLKRLSDPNQTIKALAEEFGVHRETIRRIKTDTSLPV